MLDSRRSFLAVAAAVLTGCGRRSSAPRSLSVAAVPYPAMSGLYQAAEQGYFRDAGLQVQVVEMPSTAQALPLLQEGKMDVAFMAVSPSVINAVAQDRRLRIVAGREIASPGCSDVGTLFGRRKAFPRGMDDLRQLKGKRLAIFATANMGEFMLDCFLEKAKLKSSDVRVSTLGQPEAAGALRADKIDAMISYSYLGRELRSLSEDIIRGPNFASVRPNFQYSQVVFGANLLEGDREPGSAFLAAYLKGAQDFLNGKTPQFLDDFAARNELDQKVVRESCRNTFTPDGTVDLASLQQVIDWGVKKKYCPQPVVAAAIVDLRFLEKTRT